jgi:sodium pump decarboxylase gamma subunit
MFTNLLDGWLKMNLGEAAFYALFGFLFVFCGIVLLILFFTALGKIMSVVNARRGKKNAAPKKKTEVISASEEEISPEIVAAITAAVAAFYEGENVQCDFVVKRIRKF